MEILEANASATGIALGQIYYGPLLTLNFNDPTVDPRTPDIIVTPNVGVTYTGSHKKLAEHGGFAHDDTNVILLLSKPNFQPQTVRAEVGAAQVAPTILQALGIDPSALDAVRAEGTGVLPATPSSNRSQKPVRPTKDAPSRGVLCLLAVELPIKILRR